MTLATKLKVKQLSKKLGLKEQVVVDRAVTLLWEKLDRKGSLEQETKQWEKLSDEAWRQIKN